MGKGYTSTLAIPFAFPWSEFELEDDNFFPVEWLSFRLRALDLGLGGDGIEDGADWVDGVYGEGEKGAEDRNDVDDPWRLCGSDACGKVKLDVACMYVCVGIASRKSGSECVPLGRWSLSSNPGRGCGFSFFDLDLALGDIVGAGVSLPLLLL